LIVILRNDGIRKNAGTVAAKGFGQIGSAGGHKSTARAEIDLDALKSLVDVKNDGKLQRWIISHVERRTDKK
jgi:nanoRNase/pAp phosphatase (c-di-AMP/oligoRNAs hydrolase)